MIKLLAKVILFLTLAIGYAQISRANLYELDYVSAVEDHNGELVPLVRQMSNINDVTNPTSVVVTTELTNTPVDDIVSHHWLMVQVLRYNLLAEGY